MREAKINKDSVEPLSTLPHKDPTQWLQQTRTVDSHVTGFKIECLVFAEQTDVYPLRFLFGGWYCSLPFIIFDYNWPGIISDSKWSLTSCPKVANFQLGSALGRICADLTKYDEATVFSLVGLRKIFCQSMAGGGIKNKNKISRTCHGRKWKFSVTRWEYLTHEYLISATSPDICRKKPLSWDN